MDPASGGNTTLHHKEITSLTSSWRLETNLTMSHVFSEIEFFDHTGKLSTSQRGKGAEIGDGTERWRERRAKRGLPDE